MELTPEQERKIEESINKLFTYMVHVTCKEAQFFEYQRRIELLQSLKDS